MIEGSGPKWLFDIDSLTQSMNYVPLTAGLISNEYAGTQGELNAGTSKEISQNCIVMPIWKDASYFDSPAKDVDNGEPKTAADAQKQVEDGSDNENVEQDKFEDDSSTKDVNAAGQHVNTASPEVNIVGPSVNTASSNDQDSPKDMFTMGVSHTLEATHLIPTTHNTKIHKDHPIDNVIGDVKSSVQTRRMKKPASEQGFLRDIEPTSITKALSDSSWVEAMQEELLQFKLQKVWILMDLPSGKRAIRTKWVFRNKKNERGIVIRNKVSAFLYGTIEEEVYVTQPPGFKDPDHPDKVYKEMGLKEASIRSDLHLEDAESTDCLPTATIFKELARMGYEKPSQKLTIYKAFFSPQWKYFIHTITQCLSAKSTAWNEFSSTMASLIICLATNQKFNLSKYILDAMVKHLDEGVKFLMYPRFLQVFINQQLGDMSHHKKVYVYYFHTKKIFANMKRARKDFSGRITPLFDTMIIQASKEVDEDSDHPTDSNQIPIVYQPSTSSQPKQKQKSKRRQRKEAEVARDETEHEESA
ncbi:hypothetical protein Tco_0643920, partial [Tanacetum coccineum]